MFNHLEFNCCPLLHNKTFWVSCCLIHDLAYLHSFPLVLSPCHSTWCLPCLPGPAWSLPCLPGPAWSLPCPPGLARPCPATYPACQSTLTWPPDCLPGRTGWGQAGRVGAGWGRADRAGANQRVDWRTGLPVGRAGTGHDTWKQKVCQVSWQVSNIWHSMSIW